MADPKKGTGKKPKGSDRRLYTDENPRDTVKIKFATISSITVAETSGADATFRIAVRVGGATLSGLSQYIAYNKTVPANDTISFVIGITLNQTDIVTVYASSANVAFNVFGCETLEER